MNKGDCTVENYVITIARGFGSGGKTIGRMLSENLGIPYYDKDLIKLASEESGINEALFGKSDEKVKSSIFSRPKVYSGELVKPDSPDFVSEENLFSYQAKVIKSLAEKGSCIIVGRCADFVLRDMENVIKVFIWADMPTCLKNAKIVCGIDEKEAARQIERTDKERSAYYKAHTGSSWDNVRNYDLCLNTSRLSFEKCVEIIKSYINIR